MQILALVVLSFYHFEGSFFFFFFFRAHLWGLVLRPFSTCSSLMSFSPFFTFLVAYFPSYKALFYGLSIFSDSVDFSDSKGLFFLFSSGLFCGSFYRAFLFGCDLSSTPYIGLLCLLRMHAINSCVGDTWQRLWWDDFTHNGKQAVNRLKIPQGLSTLMFRRWSEVPSRGGVRGESP